MSDPARKTSVDIRTYRRHAGLTNQQEAAILELLRGQHTDREIADLVGVDRITLYKWKTRDPWFITELNRRRDQLWQYELDRLRSLGRAALDFLAQEFVEHPSTSTALAILRHVSIPTSSPSGPTDVEAIINERAIGNRKLGEGRRRLLEKRGVLEPVTPEERYRAIREIETELDQEDPNP